MSTVGQSTIDATQPANKAQESSLAMRSNFGAAKTDINNLISKFAGTTAPTTPSFGMSWLDTSASPNILKIWDGNYWLAFLTLDQDNHVLANVIPTVLVETSADYTATGLEQFIEVDASAADKTITVPISLVQGRVPIRVRKIDQSFNVVHINDGTNDCAILSTKADANGNGGGWMDVSSNGTNLRCEGVA